MKLFRNILLVVEEPISSLEVALSRAFSLARSNQAELTLLYVAEQPRLGPFSNQYTVDEVERKLTEQAMAVIEPTLETYKSDWDVAVDVCFGTPFVEIVRDVLRHGRDLVVKASGYGGAHEYLFGGTDQHLLRKCPCPVWILHAESAGTYDNVIAAVDFDPWHENGEDEDLNDQILSLAVSVAMSDFAKLHVVHAWEPITNRIIGVFSSDFSTEQITENRDREKYRQRLLLENLESQLRKKIGEKAFDYLAPNFYLRDGNPRDVIPSTAKKMNADLVVMGTISRTGILGFLIGNTAEVILNNLECSVLTSKPAGFVSPITLD